MASSRATARGARLRRAGLALAAVAAMGAAGCSSTDALEPTTTTVSDDDAYPVVNSFLVGLEADDLAGVELTVAPGTARGGTARTDLIAAELAQYGGLPVDYGSVVVNFDDDAARAHFRAKVGEPDRTLTLQWVLQRGADQWYVDLPPRELSPAQIG